MIKLVYCLKRKTGTSREEFQQYWREHHGAFIASIAEKYRIRRYVQSHAVGSSLTEIMNQSRGLDGGDYDGVTEIWWDSEADFIEAASTAEGQELSRLFVEDEANFVDFAASRAFFTQEISIVGKLG